MPIGRIFAVILFSVSNLFTKKVNAIGIANLPTAIAAYHSLTRASKKKKMSEKWRLYLLVIFHSVVVISGLFGKLPTVIQANAVWKILVGVYESIQTRHDLALAEAKKAGNPDFDPTLLQKQFSLTHILKDALFMTTNHGGDEEDVNEIGKNGSADGKSLQKIKDPNKSKTKQAHLAAKRTKNVLKGKRDSATDDLVWGAFQVAFIVMDETIPKAIGYAWLMFLLSVFEDVLLNHEISMAKRIRRLVWLVSVGYMSGKLVIPDAVKEKWLAYQEQALHSIQNE